MTHQNLIQVRILDLSIQVKSEDSIQVFKLSQKIEIEYWFEIFDSTRQDIIDHLTKPAKTDYKLTKLASVKNICLVELLAHKL